MKKFFSINFLLIIFMLITVACSNATKSNEDEGNGEPSDNFNSEGYPIVDESITLSMMGPKHAVVGDWDQLQFFEVMNKKTNIDFNFQTIPDQDFVEERNVLLASGEYPDIFFGGQLNDADIMKYGEQGTLIPLEDLIENYAPNIKEMFEKNPDVKKSVTSLDGHIYALPTLDESVMMAYPKMWVNGSWLENLDINELPQTTDELYDLLKAFKTQDPNQNGENDEIPMSSIKLEQEERPILAAFGLLESDIEEVDGEVRYNPIEPNYKEYLTYMNKLWEEELLDIETFSQSFDQQVSKGNSDQVGMFSAITAQIILGGNEPNHSMLPVLTSPVNDEKVYTQGAGIITGTFAISSTNKHPEATIRWIDYIYSLEGSTLLSYGEEGYLWEWVDENMDKRQLISHEEENYKGGKITPGVGVWVPLWSRPEIEASFMDPIQDQAIELSNEELAPYAKVPYPLVQFTEEERNKFNQIEADLNTYVDTSTAEFITGQKELTEWDNYLTTMNELRVEEYIEIHQDAYDRWSQLE